jgi:OOP family OmpA-OmpF porin
MQERTLTRQLLLAVIVVVALLNGTASLAAPGDQPVQPLPPSARVADDKERVRSTTLPARGLFLGDRLSERAREQLTGLLVDASDLNVEVALVVPTGPWQIDGSGAGERDLTPARLQALRRFLTERGVDPKRVFVESRVDDKIAEPQLTVQMVGRPAAD